MKADSTLTARARAFFDRYGRDFDSADWSSFVAHYHEPAISVRGDGTTKLLTNHADAKALFTQAWDAWRGEGYARFTISGLFAIEVGTRSMLVTLNWHLMRADGTEIRKWRQSYQLLLVEGTWKVLSSTFHAT